MKVQGRWPASKAPSKLSDQEQSDVQGAIFRCNVKQRKRHFWHGSWMTPDGPPCGCEGGWGGPHDTLHCSHRQRPNDNSERPTGGNIFSRIWHQVWLTTFSSTYVASLRVRKGLLLLTLTTWKSRLNSKTREKHLVKGSVEANVARWEHFIFIFFPGTLLRHRCRSLAIRAGL